MKENQKLSSVNDIDFVCSCVKQWIECCEKNNKIISSESVEHSALLRRLLSGKQMHLNKPPLRFGYPAWELVDADENEIKEISENFDEVIIDQHEGYLWLNREFKTLTYPRLNLYFQYLEKECVPQVECLAENANPEDYKYRGKFLKKIEPLK